MQWPDINAAGVMICGFILESEMPSLGSVRRAAEPVSVVTKSEMLTPVFAGGGGGSLLRQPPGCGGGSYIASFCPAGGRK